MAFLITGNQPELMGQGSRYRLPKPCRSASNPVISTDTDNIDLYSSSISIPSGIGINIPVCSFLVTGSEPSLGMQVVVFKGKMVSDPAPSNHDHGQIGKVNIVNYKIYVIDEAPDK